jgi:IS5 family transposase
MGFPRGELDMAHRTIGQERFGFAERTRPESSLDELGRLINWASVAALLDPLFSAAKGEPAWPPLAMFKALLLSIWYDLSDVKLAEALDDRASFRRFCGFSGTEATPERTAFVRFRKELVAHNLDRLLFTALTAQLKSKAVTVKTGTLVDATIIASASEDDDDARWVKHKGKPAVHGFKAHVGADADTALVEEVSITSANINDGRAGPEALPDNPGEVFADRAPIAAITSAMRCGQRATYHGSSPPACGAATSRKRCANSTNGINRSIAYVVGSRRFSEPGSAATACDGCDGEASPKPPSKSTSPPSPTTSSAP